MGDLLTNLATGIDRLNAWTGRVIAWLTLGMVVVMFSIVVLRYGFSWNSIAVQESVSYLHALVFTLGAAYTFRHDEHVRVDIFYRGMSERRRAMVDFGGTLLFLIPFCLFLGYQSLGYAVESWTRLEGSRQTGGLPLVFLMKSYLPAMCLLLLLHAVSELIRHGRTLFKSAVSPGDAA